MPEIRSDCHCQLGALALSLSHLTNRPEWCTLAPPAQTLQRKLKCSRTCEGKENGDMDSASKQHTARSLFTAQI
ncbi:MAG: hypothetical protein RML95_15845 [Anaerolineae bacterium]|nr:hypothetical protein [Anaerolineae bacterium]